MTINEKIKDILTKLLIVSSVIFWLWVEYGPPSPIDDVITMTGVYFMLACYGYFLYQFLKVLWLKFKEAYLS